MMEYREVQEVLLKELSYFVNKGNSKQVLAIFSDIVYELDPPDMKDDIQYGAHVSAVLGTLWNIVQSYPANAPQKKRLFHLFCRMEDLICGKEDDEYVD